MKRDGWRNTRVAPCGTHHLREDKALYAERFSRVLPFHAPGLAPVHDGQQAWHITPDGAPAYARAFADAFGFYEHLAAVRGKGGRGWFHIHPDGSPAYAGRYAWCGNFQGGRCVVCAEGRYRHIAGDGRPAYGETHAYAGDFREGCAVVAGDDGRRRHILADGAPAHPHRYRDLGVYHKGYACARDENGWTHIDRSGLPINDRRYASVEPFYNGRALVRTFDDQTLVISQPGDTVVVVGSSVPAPALAQETTETPDPIAGERHRRFHELSSDMVGYWKTFAIAAAVKLEVPEKLPVADDEMTARFGASAAGMKLLFAALEQMNITANTGGVWRLTAKGELLAKGDFSLADAALVWGEFAGGGVEAWVDAVTGASADFFAEIAPHRATVRRHQRMLAAYAKNDYQRLADILPLEAVRHLIDAGGGDGTVARMIAKKWPNLNITILERADVLQWPETRDGGNSGNGGERITQVPGDIFSRWPLAADAVLLARILHDWNDEKAARILAQANEALPAGGKLFVVEADGGTPGAMVSLHLLAASGGRERTRRAYRALLAKTGFAWVEHRPMNSSVSLLIAEKTRPARHP